VRNGDQEKEAGIEVRRRSQESRSGEGGRNRGQEKEAGIEVRKRRQEYKTE
jgi:hypothetical protein